jgi:DNA (cytosine-5)-methyltransferase 1
VTSIDTYVSQEKPPTCIESFSGAGGMALGLHRAGFEIRLAFDNSPAAVETYSANMKYPAIVQDASKISAEQVLGLIGLKRGELDLWSGGPPCQGFSTQKRDADTNDPRNRLVSHYIKLVQGVLPKAFLFENVAIFGRKRGQRFVEEMQTVLSDYDIHAEFLNSADWGVAQTRTRFIAIGIRKDLEAVLEPLRATSEGWSTVGDILKDIPEPPEDYSEHPDFPNHQRARVTRVNVERFSHVPQGGGWRDIPYELRLECHKRVKTKTGGWSDVYGRLKWDGQCPTITGGFDSFTRGRYGHPLSDRPITPYEAARLQGFPSTFRFYGNRSDIRAQIGNALPPPLAQALGESILVTLNRSR